MTIMGIRKVIKPPNYVSVYDLRVQDRIKKKKLLCSNLNTKTDSFWNFDNQSKPAYT